MSDSEGESSRERDRLKRERPTRFSDPSRERSLDRGKDRGGLKSSVCRVYVSNIPYEYRWQDLKDLFRNQVGDVSFVELFVDEADKPRGCGIVEFSDNDSVKKCLEVMHRFELKGRKLVIKEDFGNQRDKYGNLIGTAASKRAKDHEEGRDRFRDDRRGTGQSNRSHQVLSDNKCGNTYGLSPQFLESLRVNLPLINRVFIANLDYKVDRKKLKEVFRLAGKIQAIDLPFDKDGKSRGFAVVEYDHPVEAVQAISMFHNHYLYDRAMTVRMDREGDRPIFKLPDGLKGIGMGLGSSGEPLKDVARNLPSLSQTPVNPGAGLLGPVPSVTLVGNALSNFNSVNSSALNTLNTNAAVLQAANLAAVGGLSSSLLAGNIGGGGLTAASLANNPLVQNSSVANMTTSGNLGSNSLGSSNFNRSNMSRSQTGSGYQSQGMSHNQNYMSGGNRNYDSKSSDFNFGSTGRDNHNPTNNVYSTVNNGSQMIRPTGGNTGMTGKSGGYSNKIVISNLPPSASYKMLSEKCNEFGVVQRIENKGNNGALVVFSSEWEAERALNQSNMSATDAERSRERERTSRDRSRFTDQSRERSADRGKSRGGMKSSSCRVYVSNIPYEYRWQDLKDLFRSEVGDVAFVELFVDENDKARGCGIVEFSDTASVKKCLDVMHRFELKGRKLVIKEDFGNQRDKFGNLVGSAASKRAREREDGRDRFRDGRGSGFDLSNQINTSNSDFSDNKWGNTYGLSPQFLESLGINVPLINRVFIANLDYKVDKKKLKEVFRLAGKIQRIDLSSDKDGKSRGFAVLEYDHPVEAVQAISMFHNQVLYDRVMTVRMDREGDRPIVKLPEGLKDIGMGLGSNGEPLRDVARNLPSIAPAQSHSGAGILGAVPTVQLGIGSALNNLNTAVGSSALNNAAVLQAANLASVGGLSNNLLANSLGGGDLGLAAASLVNNPLVQTQSLAALTTGGNLGGSSLNNSNFSRNELGNNQSNSNFQSSVLSQNKSYLGGGNRNFDDKSSNFDFGSQDRDSRKSNVYNQVNNGNQMLRTGGNSGTGGESGGYSNKILISNLPPNASYKMITEKCREFGEVQRFEDKGNSGILVVFASEWEAETAISILLKLNRVFIVLKICFAFFLNFFTENMDRARINGRTIDVRFFY
ncbi:hypothetical protein FQR65_LT08844 [Abscondita terminalis]|nr:hypothetical protein FQR65_LT08844 [Abscondita terminalis]